MSTSLSIPSALNTKQLHGTPFQRYPTFGPQLFKVPNRFIQFTPAQYFHHILTVILVYRNRDPRLMGAQLKYAS